MHLKISVLAYTDFDLMISTGMRHFPNLRCMYINDVNLSLSILACFFESCPNLVVFYFHGIVTRCEDMKDRKVWKAGHAGKKIMKGVVVCSLSNPIRAMTIDGGCRAICRCELNLKVLFGDVDFDNPYSKHIYDLHIMTIAEGCLQLVAIELSGSGVNVTDDAVRALLWYCPAIEELSFLDTAVTIDTIHALKSYRPLALLTLGNHRRDGVANQFATTDAEIALSELL
ncbi:hypothetical protein BDK51DRAFT_44126 [Blyttiomyces helicus]|uniref:F-box domain-containing protein n=1 Tax=Blyttiomyces helicus TaxID=388810 RepID=A0A4P9WHF6_9FUNG|nr:hypothetical protein BDK51DRAFT_44126 [Blyttiomyces helicus]|eukprot:RKO91283.1 hypothetical protein BDK51DRAFT_44126 [Blyttiomyces helicus]